MRNPMKTHFYNRTGYILLSIEIPRCFIELDEYFDVVFKTDRDVFLHPSVALVENLCRRMADVEWYAQCIDKENDSQDIGKSAILIGTLLVGYFTSCKSLLDAGAITLTKVYRLPLKNKRQDFSKDEFWKQLKNAEASVFSRYYPFKQLFDEIGEWRDAALHRLTPLVLPHGPGDPSETPRTKQTIMVVSRPDVDIPKLVKTLDNTKWLEPLYFHKKWQIQLIKFCGEICLDIKDQFNPADY